MTPGGAETAPSLYEQAFSGAVGGASAPASTPALEKAAPADEDDRVKEPDEATYDEEQWQRSMEESRFLAPGDDSSGTPPPGSGQAEAGSAPELEELLKKVPQRSQDLVDSLFRGRFIGVKALDRKKLF